MAQSTSHLRIRPYVSSDLDQVRFTISKAQMEPLTVANQRSYVHPVTIATWVVLSSLFIQFMDWWPQSQKYGGLLAYLTPLPAFAATAVPILFFFDWLNRPFFERATQKVLRHPDLLDIQHKYSLTPSSGFYILDFEDRMIGVLGLDASGSSPGTGKERQATRAIIRHFYVADPYRQTGVQNDLLAHAINQAFSASPEISSIEAGYSMLNPYIKRALLEHGFKISSAERKGLFINWEVGVTVLQRTAWLNRQDSKSNSNPSSGSTTRK